MLNRYRFQSSPGRIASFTMTCFFGGMAIEMIKVHLVIGDISYYKVARRKALEYHTRQVYQTLKFKDASFDVGDDLFNLPNKSNVKIEHAEDD